MKFLISILVNGLLVYFVAWLLDGVSIVGYGAALITGLLLAILNNFIRPVIVFLTLPLTIITFGLFLLVINGVMVLIADQLVPGFTVDGLIWGILFSIILAIANFFIHPEGLSVS